MPYQQLFKSTVILVCTTKPSEDEKGSNAIAGNTRRTSRAWTVKSVSHEDGKRMCVLNQDSDKG
jgi:hypothetical protein